MKIVFLTIFPELVSTLTKELSIIRRAISRENLNFEIVDIRNFASGGYKQVDDYVYGTGKGMILRIDIVYSALQFAKKKLLNPYIILPSPRGTVLSNRVARDLSNFEELLFICPNYEGIDSRILRFVNEEISIGDYVISSGELASFVILEAILRFKYVSLVKSKNVLDDSFNYASFDNLLEPFQYTRPRQFNIESNSISIDPYLYSGDHELIYRNNLIEAISITISRRPDLFKQFINKYPFIDQNIIFESFSNNIIPS